MRRKSERLVGLVVLAVLAGTACSGAKAPSAVGVNESQAPGDVPSGSAPANASTAPGASAAPGQPNQPGQPGQHNQPGQPNQPGLPGDPGQPSQPGGPPPVDLFRGSLDTRGITADKITLCAHAALSYGPAFNTTKDDLNVYWQALNDNGGIYGRRVETTYEDDNYDPQTAVSAATTCAGKNPFAILGGIGFDQIPAVRNWAEQHKELYLYHDATANGAAGKQYSFSSLPTVEKLGQMFAELAVSKFKDKKIGILYRNSEFWDPGFKAFQALAKAKHLDVVLSVPVENKQGHYAQELKALKDKGAEVVWAWENALAATEMINQTPTGWKPTWMVFPFNLTTQTIVDTSFDIYGVAAWPAYSYHDYAGPFASYANDIKLFEQQYATYRSNVDLSGVGGDLLFLNWVAQKALAEMFKRCGPSCTRDAFAALMRNYHGVVSPSCPADFRGNGHLGGDRVDVFHTYTGQSGKLGWKPIARCVNSF